MTNLTAAELDRWIKDEEMRLLREKVRRQLNPTLAEAMRDFEEEQARNLVRSRAGASDTSVAGTFLDRSDSAGAEVAATGSQSASRRSVGKWVEGLPSDEDLAKELAAERAKKRHGATKRIADKYGCSVDTIQRRVKKKAAQGSSVFSLVRPSRKR